GDYAAAAALLQDVIDAPETDTIKWVATLRLARLKIEMNQLDEASALVTTKVPEAFAGQALELKGDIQRARGDVEGARVAYEDARPGAGSVKNLLLPVLPFIALLQACSSARPDAVEPTPLASFEKAFDVDRLWHRDAGFGNRRGSLMLPPVVTDRFVYTVDVRGRLQCFERETGKKRWRRDLGFRVGGMGVGDGMIELGTRDGDAVGLDGDGGAGKWRARLSSEVLAAPTLTGDKVLAQTIDGRLHALEAEGGAPRWVYEETVPV